VGTQESLLHRALIGRVNEIPAPSGRLLAEFDRLQDVLREHGKYIVRVFPEYTPHDPSLHLDHLFALSDRILGPDLYGRLNAAELAVFAFSLFAHDWGMAVSDPEQLMIEGSAPKSELVELLPGEPNGTRKYLAQARDEGIPVDQAWINYLRKTHGLRSGARLRRWLTPLSAQFAEAVARAAEGHTLPIEDIRQLGAYPASYPLFGQIVNLAAIANYVRIVDLLDIGENRTPFALWKFVQPQHPVSAIEWRKHRSLSAVAVRKIGESRQLSVGGIVDDVRVFAGIADLRAWADTEFRESMSNLRNLGPPYSLDLDTQIDWNIQARGFEPELARFEIDRLSVLGLLSRELYESQPFAFVRELLQNSVDAIDARRALLERVGTAVVGKIEIAVHSNSDGVTISWSDNGIGMDSFVFKNFFSRIGRSWYKSDEFKRAGIVTDPISKFGIGFLSCFSVAEHIVVHTRQSPEIEQPSVGYRIEIPDLNSHFRISKVDELSVGTKIELFVRSGSALWFSVDGFCRHLERFAAYIGHQVVVTVQGNERQLVSFSRRDIAEWKGLPFENTPALEARSVVAQEEDSLRETTRRLDLRFGGFGKLYDGAYSALIPTCFGKIEKLGNWEWNLSGREVDTQSYIHNSSDDVYVKGIFAGDCRLTSRGQYEPRGLSTGVSNRGEWIGPKVSVNLSLPSLVRFNLARTSGDYQSSNWQSEMWYEIASQVSAAVLPNGSDSLLQAAQAIGVASRFAGIPDYALTNIVGVDKWPVFVLSSSDAMALTSFQQLVSDDVVYEAPTELAFGLENYSQGETFLEDVARLDGWQGRPVALIQPHGRNRQPYWVEPITRPLEGILSTLKYSVSAIETFNVSGNVGEPLVCRVWKKQSDSMPQSLESYIANDEIIRNPSLLKLALGRYMPELYPFPDQVNNYAAIGSAFWNTNSSKINQIVRTLLLLAHRFHQKQVSMSSRERIQNLTSEKYIGYIVLCSRSGRRVAIDLHSELLKVAASEGLGPCSALTEGDAFPGSIGRYENPYHYDLRNWRTSSQVPTSMR